MKDYSSWIDKGAEHSHRAADMALNATAEGLKSANDKAHEAIDVLVDLVKRYTERGADKAEAISERASRLSQDASKLSVEDAKAYAREYADSAVDFARKEPVKTAAVAVGVGLLVAWLVSGSKKE